MKQSETLLLKQSEVAKLLSLEECINAVEEAFKLHAEGKALPPGILGVHVQDGGFHIKAGVLNLRRSYFVAKVNANFPNNRERHGLPLIQGVIVICDGENGQLLGMMDSMEITTLRTGAATAIAAKYLSRQDSKTATICGCGNQGIVSLRMLMKVRQLEKVYAYDVNKEQALKFAQELSETLKIQIEVVESLGNALNQSDICVTCTPSKRPYLRYEDLRPGTFIAAVGADSEEKQELEASVLASGKIVVDLLDQCANIGELHHALEQGMVTRNKVHAELGEIIAGRKKGRISEEEIIIFDSTGMALQDVASAAIVYEKAIHQGIGITLDFAG